MKKILFQIVSFCLCTAILCSAFSSTSSASDMPASAQEVWNGVSAASFCLMDGETGEVLKSSSKDQKMPIASTTKVMTAIVVLESEDVEKLVTIPKAACGIEGSSMYLYPNEKLTVLQLLYGLLLESANDAAVALALQTSGSIEAFAEKMNEKATAIGMANSHFTNPNGLHDEMHYSSAHDLAKLMQYSLKNELFCKIVGTKSLTLTLDNGKQQTLSNHNRLLRTIPNYLGGKTGYTRAAGRCLVSAAQENDKTMICTTLNDPNDWADHTALLQYGFSLYTYHKLLSPYELELVMPVVGGKSAETVLTNADEVFVNTKSNSEITKIIEAPHFSYAPVVGLQPEEGGEPSGAVASPIGRCIFLQDGKEIASCPLYAKNSVSRVEQKNLWQKFCEWIKGIF